MSTIFSSGLTVRESRWTVWKTVQSVKTLVTQYEDDNNTYTIWGYDGPEVHVCQIFKGSVPESALSAYSQEQNDSDRTDFETHYLSTANASLDSKIKPISIAGSPKNNSGAPRIAIEKPDVSKATMFSHDWSNPTTWTTHAVRVVDEIANPDVAEVYTVYALDHVNVIDTYHGFITAEDFLKDSDNNSYRVVVKVNNTTKTEQDPHYGTGGDYTINYETGKITFLSALTANDEVKVTYHYAGSSEFRIKPAAGKRLSIALVEVQFSDDVVLTDSVTFQPYGYVDVFAPQYTPTPYPSGTLIPLGNPIVYKGMRDYQNDAVRSYVAYPAMGGNSWRGMTTPVLVLDWDYISSTTLLSSAGMEVRVKLQHDTPFGGTYATASFYCVSDNE